MQENSHSILVAMQEILNYLKKC